LSSFEV